MDNWGDPWADHVNVDYTQTPAKNEHEHEHKATLSYTPAPTLLNGFLDDAGWASDNDKSAWTLATPTLPAHEDIARSEASGSPTIVQADAVDECPATPNRPVHAHSDDDESSADTSTSPSETSHQNIARESPRTSYEDERTIELSVQKLDLHNPAAQDAPQDETPQEISATASGNEYAVDEDLLNALHAPPSSIEDLGEAAQDPIYSTSARKAWYRLTRQQTLREFNNGNDDDNYVRVTWSNAHIRSEVSKIVTRWAREDRISGTGPGARASFYWDTTAPIVSTAPTMHRHQRSSLNSLSAEIPTKDLPSLSANPTAAFDWSSSATPDPWQLNSPDLPSDIPSGTFRPGSSAAVQGERPATSLEITPQVSDRASLELTTVAAQVVPITTSPSLVTIPRPPTDTLDPWGALDRLDTSSLAISNKELVIAPIADEEDDEWGELVSSPAISTPITNEPSSQETTRSNTFSTPSSTPLSLKVSPRQELPSDSIHASPIVRLRSTISPTSARFKANPFIPLHVEQGPVGPSILKSAKRTHPASGSKQYDFAMHESSTSNEVGKTSEHAVEAHNANEPSAAEPIDRQPMIERSQSESIADPEATARLSNTSGLECLTESSVNLADDPWMDADFSFFESSANPPAGFDHIHESMPTSGSPSHITRASLSATPIVSPSTPKEPLQMDQPNTGVANFEQRRKLEEDQIIQDILQRLPDLGYMLK